MENAGPERHDLILKGGRVIDPASGHDGIADVAFAGGRVAGLADRIDANRARQSRDVTGCVVTPGLIDMHTHVYWGGSSLSVEADRFARSSAVTTLVDTGSAGPGNFAGFRAHVIDRSDTRILAYLHISHAGIYAFSRRIMVGESENIWLMDPETCTEVAEANRDLIVGVKVRLGRWTSGANGIAPLHYARAAAEAAGLPLMVHIDDPPPSYEEVLAQMKAGDVLTHAFRSATNAPCTPGGAVKAAVKEARARGVLFDIGHGMGSFCLHTARRMLAAGFLPDTISSDVHLLCIDGPAYDLLVTMSKFLALGMDLSAVIAATTTNAARALGRPDLGGLGEGMTGDASVLRIEDGNFEFEDTEGNRFTGDQRLVPVGTVQNGVWHDAVPYQAA